MLTMISRENPDGCAEVNMPYVVVVYHVTTVAMDMGCWRQTIRQTIRQTNTIERWTDRKMEKQSGIWHRYNSFILEDDILGRRCAKN